MQVFVLSWDDRAGCIRSFATDSWGSSGHPTKPLVPSHSRNGTANSIGSEHVARQSEERATFRTAARKGRSASAPIASGACFAPAQRHQPSGNYRGCSRRKGQFYQGCSRLVARPCRQGSSQSFRTSDHIQTLPWLRNRHTPSVAGSCTGKSWTGRTSVLARRSGPLHAHACALFAPCLLQRLLDVDTRSFEIDRFSGLLPEPAASFRKSICSASNSPSLECDEKTLERSNDQMCVQQGSPFVHYGDWHTESQWGEC